MLETPRYVHEHYAMHTARKPNSVTLKKVLGSQQDHKCIYCGAKTNLKQPNSRYRRTIDHLVPKTRGRRTNWTNIVIACYGCNQEKGDKFTLDHLALLQAREYVMRNLKDFKEIKYVL